MDKLNKKILAFAENQDMYIMPHYDRDQYSKNMLIEKLHIMQSPQSMECF